MVLRACLPPVHVHVDCSLILTGIQTGRRWCTFSRRPHADVWQLIWACIEDIGLGPDGVSFHKVKAHTSQRRTAEAELPEQRIMIANARADEMARCGALLGVTSSSKSLSIQ